MGKALDPLRDSVQRAVEALAGGLLAHPGSRSLRQRLRSGELSLDDVYRRLLRLVFRQIFALLAEEQGASSPSLDDLRPGLADLAPGEQAWLEARRALVMVDDGRAPGPARWGEVGAEGLGAIYESLLELEPALDARGRRLRLQAREGRARRSTGSYYTPPGLVDRVLDSALEPLLDRACSGKPAAEAEASLLDLKVCDPACGPGYFLMEASRRIARRIARLRSGERDPGPDELRRALGEVVGRCVYGVDLDPLAVELCRMALRMESSEPGHPPPSLERRIVWGHSLLGATPRNITQLSPLLPPGEPCVHWHLTFPEVFVARGEGELSDETGWEGGFDAVVGNPPWIAHAGRAAQRLPEPQRAFYSAANPAFSGYRSTHGMFVYQAATLVRPGGRLGLVVPTSIADLEGYRPARAAHDRCCRVVEPLHDFGDGAFEGVFQPCMALVSEGVRHGRGQALAGEEWTLERRDLSPEELSLLSLLSRLPPLPSELFGERGLQTTRETRALLHEATVPSGKHTSPIREGTDVREMCLLPPRVWFCPEELLGKVRRPSEFAEVAVVIRQTARFPIAARSDGGAFRNSLLACFVRPPWTAGLLLCLFASRVVRWFHYQRFRDARQGMPQVKIGHLRAVPRPPFLTEGRAAELEALGERVSARNTGLEPGERERLDRLVFEAYGLGEREIALLSAWVFPR